MVDALLRIEGLTKRSGGVVASDGVVVRDRAAEADDRVGCRGLDRVPLLDLAVAPARGQHRVIGRRSVRIDVREPARQFGAAAEHLGEGLPDTLAHDGVELGPSIPRDRRLERVGDQTEAGVQTGIDADERVAPRTDAPTFRPPRWPTLPAPRPSWRPAPPLPADDARATVRPARAS